MANQATTTQTTTNITLAAVLAAIKTNPELVKELRKAIGDAGTIRLTAEQGALLKAGEAKDDKNPTLKGNIEFVDAAGKRYFGRVNLGAVREDEAAREGGSGPADCPAEPDRCCPGCCWDSGGRQGRDQGPVGQPQQLGR